MYTKNSFPLTVDCMDTLDDAAPSKMDHIFERISKRNKERQNYLDVKLEQRHKDSPDSEGADYFSQIFAERVKEIELKIKNVSEASVEKLVGVDLARHFAEITVDIQELQRYLTNSTMFLTDFKIKACQSIINDVTQTCEENKLRLMPKKKFGFRQRKVTPQPILNPKLTKSIIENCGQKTESMSSNSKINYTLCNRRDAYICLKGSEVNGIDVTIADLNNCFVELQGGAGSVQISNCTECTFLFGPIARSLFAEYCNKCLLNVACQQMRLHSSTQCCVNLHVTCRAIIEDCKGIEVAPYNYSYPDIEDDFKYTNLSREQNNYTDVADFNWLSPDVPSPNWRLVEESPTTTWREKKEQFIKSYVDKASL